MTEYEITCILRQTTGEEEQGAVSAEISRQVTEAGGSVDHASPAVRKQLAYPIHDQQRGVVQVLNVSLESERLADLQEWLRRHESVLRFAVLKTPRREELPADILEQMERAKAAPAVEPESQKEVTMADVEKGIEEALTEEIK